MAVLHIISYHSLSSGNWHIGMSRGDERGQTAQAPKLTGAPKNYEMIL